MSLQSNLFKSMTSWLAPRLSPSALPEIENPQDEEQRFLDSIAHLPLDEQRQRLQRRLMYRRMAQRQGIMEAEAHTYAQVDERDRVHW